MPTYFGIQTYDQAIWIETTYGIYNAASYSCPGSGNQNIQEISILCGKDEVTTPNIRLGVYNTSDALVAEGTGVIALVESPSWQGHMTQASVKTAGGSSPGVLIGGVSYRMVVANDGGTYEFACVQQINGSKFVETDYTGGLPETLFAGTSTNYLWTIRCGVDPAAAGPSNIATLQGLAFSSVSTIQGLAKASIASLQGVT